MLYKSVIIFILSIYLFFIILFIIIFFLTVFLLVFIITIIIYFFLNPRKKRVGKKLKKVKKNGEVNVPSGRPTQNYCATKQN